MRILIHALIIAFSIFATHSTYAKSLNSLDQTKDLVEEATDLFGQNKIKEGILVLKEYWPIPEAEITNLINQTEMQWKMVSTRFGEPIDVEFVREEKINDTLVQYIYLQKFENHAVRWLIMFYKPRDIWKVNNVTWDDQIKLLFNK